MGPRGAVLSVLVALVCLGPGASSTQAVGGIPFQILLEADGSGHIFMNDGSVPSWKACRPDLTACAPFATGNFKTGGAPPETVFWAGGSLLTPVWKGNVHPVTPPFVRGTVRGNKVVTPEAGLWTGGWEGDYDSLSLSICMTPAGEHCLQVNHEGRRDEECGARGETLIDPAFAGRYLQVVNRRYGRGTVFSGVGHPAYYSIPRVEPGPTVSVAVVGKISPAIGPPSVECGFAPLFEASITDDGSADVSCRLVGCRVVLIAQRGRRQARATRKFAPAPTCCSPPERLRLNPSSLDGLEGGPVRVAVKINGTTTARRIVKIGPLPVAAEYPEQEPGSGRRP